ncbi:hypothetical protein [Actinoalloteichus hymeniacidonis]|uniref:Uncharacterized protein n=1 Tax=Actinoalloteichus hymeniacidonis TaxID=340345 RepID=A0AAC9MXY7_9PSEU|nr:hypothetical protein [Actinoalloteichus hymeniacidonis]AOS62760.1 hypothetical protein TL08_09725 [Actinoalloteichus hymeniacidonis]MBB5909209.1 hypothetical protein [Actinoalloteichus hymeniacidonis]
MSPRRYGSVRRGGGTRLVALLVIIALAGGAGLSALVGLGMSGWTAVALLVAVIGVPAAVILRRPPSDRQPPFAGRDGR